MNTSKTDKQDREWRVKKYDIGSLTGVRDYFVAPNGNEYDSYEMLGLFNAILASHSHLTQALERISIAEHFRFDGRLTGQSALSMSEEARTALDDASLINWMI